MSFQSRQLYPLYSVRSSVSPGRGEVAASGSVATKLLVSTRRDHFRAYVSPNGKESLTTFTRLRLLRRRRVRSPIQRLSIVRVGTLCIGSGDVVLTERLLLAQPAAGTRERRAGGG